MYFTRLRESRERYHGGLRQLADHMHVVTRTLSNDPNKTFAKDSPVPLRQQVLSRQASAAAIAVVAAAPAAKSPTIAETSLIFPPVTHAMLHR